MTPSMIVRSALAPFRDATNRSYTLERWYRVRRLRSRTRRLTRPPIVVHQMGKVGSSSIAAGISAMYPGRVDQVHHLASDALEREEALYRSAFAERRKIDGHLVHSINLRREIDRGGLHPGAKVISLVREPMSWRISSFFQTLAFRVPNLEQRCGCNDLSSLADEVIAQFHGPGWWHDDRIWSFFTGEFAPVWTVDVFESPFDQDAGWQTYEGGRRPALVGRYEDLATHGEAAIGDFIRLDGVRLPRRQVTEEKYYADLVSVVQQRLRFDAVYLDSVYAGAGVTHFYSPSERDALRARWDTLS